MRPDIPLSNRLHLRRDPELIRARVAVYLVFLANGLGFANLVPRFPQIVARLDLSKAAFGQAVAASVSEPWWRGVLAHLPPDLGEGR